MDAKINSGEKEQKHHHYLKGSVFCMECDSRLIVQMSKNRHGTVCPYFVCAGRHEKRTDCTLPAVLIAVVEHAIEEIYREEWISRGDRRLVERFIHEELKRMFPDIEASMERLKRKVASLHSQRTKLLQAHYADAISVEQLKQEQERISAELSASEREIDESSMSNEKIETAIRGALDHIDRARMVYGLSDGRNKRAINQSMFERFVVGRQGIVKSSFKPDYEFLISDELIKAARAHLSRTKEGEPETASPSLTDLVVESERTQHSEVLGSRSVSLVGRPGLEPGTLGLKGLWC